MQAAYRGITELGLSVEISHYEAVFCPIRYSQPEKTVETRGKIIISLRILIISVAGYRSRKTRGVIYIVCALK